MDRSQEKVSSSKAKLQTLDQGNIHQNVHENQAGIIGINRVGQRKNSTESSTDNLRYVEGRNGIEGVNTRKTEPLMQAYLHASTPGASLGLPYMTNPSMDPRALGNFFYGPQMIGFPGYPGVYGQRLVNGDDMRENRSSTSTPADRPDSARDPKEPIRTESVIKIATDRPDSRKQEPVDKRQSRPSSDEYTRQFTDRNGELESSRNMNIYRGSRDKLENPLATTNGDFRNTISKQMTEMSSSERTIGGFSSYPTQSVYTKSLTPVSHPGDYTPNTDYQKTVTTSSNMYASMPKLTPIAPRGFSFPNFPANSTAEVTERQSMSGSVWRPPMGYLTRDYPLTSASEALVSRRSSAGENLSRTEETPETRGSYLPHSVHESSSRPQDNFASRERHFPYAWERNHPELSPRYPGHSAYQGYGYARTFQPKRPSEKENFKETEDVRSRTINSIKESSISPDRSSASRYAKDAPKAPSADTNKNSKEQTNPNYKSSLASNQNQANLSKNEKPVVPENVRYKVKDDRKCVLKSDKVTVYPRKGMAYVVSVRETPQKVSDYFSNGRLPHSDVATVSSDSNERNQLPSGYEAASKKDEAQRHGSMREGAVKGQEKNVPDGTPGGDYPRRAVDTLNNNRAISVDETKKNNDRNNNSSFGTYQFPGYPSQSERPRASNRITLSQDKVFVPPNATLEMFEKRELEMERAAASCRSADAARTGQFGSNVKSKQQGRKDNEVDSRNQSPETNPRITSNKLENKVSRSDVSSKGSDDEDLKIIDDKKDSQQRNIRTEEKRLSSSPRLSRITSPATTTSSSSNPPFLTPFGVNFPPRRNTNDNDLAARESSERSLQAAAYMYGAGNIPYQTNSPYMGSNVRPDMQVMLPMDPAMFYSGLYKQHMMDPSQGGGVVMQDPLTGSLVVVPEAMINPNMFSPLAAESQLMLDPARFWGMQASMEDPRWQQFYQQQKQLYEHQLEKYKQEMMIAQQQGRWQGYSVYPFYQKQLEAQRKEENERSLRTADQRPKSRESQSNQPRAADKNEDSIPKEKKSNSTEERIFNDSRRDESDTRRDSSKIPPEFPGEPRSVTSYPEKQEKVLVKESVKPPSTEYLEAREKAKEILQQEDQDRQFQQYMLKEPVFNPSKFPFTRIPTTLPASSQNLKSPLEVPRDRVQDLRENSRGESIQNSETSRAEMSPQVVIAASTLANMDFGTRFPFNQQNTMQLENSKVPRESDQLDGTGKRTLTNQNISRDENAVYQSLAIGQSPTDSGASEPIIYSSQIQQLYSPTTSISSMTPVTPSTIHEHREQLTESSSSEKGSFDIPKGSFLRDPTRTKSSSTLSQSSAKNDYLSNGEEECSRLLVAKAEKLPQDEELEVIRIDRPYANAGAEPGDISTVNKQDTDLLMSLAKVSNEGIESPSSKSEIFWVACSDDELEDFEVRTINSSAKPRELELEGHNKENYFKFSLQNARSEDEKKCIREKIEKLREVAKNRTREERFTALTRQKELKSPASIVHSVTSSLNEVLDMNVMEKDIRMRLADLQKKYREKHRELARLQPRSKEGNDDSNAGKNTPIKRGPGRPRKRKYFGASSRSDKLTTPSLTSNGSLDLTTKSGASSPSSSCPQSPGFKSITSEENSIVKEEPVKKKRKRSNTNKVEESVPTMPSPPQIASPTETELKPTPVKPSRKTPTLTAKSKIPTSTIITTSTTTSNMEKLISAISPSMLDDSSTMETESESSTSDFKTMPTKPKPKKPKKIIKKEKHPGTEDSTENKEKMSPDSVKDICGSPTSINIKKVRNPKKTKKKDKPSLTPKTDSEFVFPNEKVVVGKSVIKQEFPKTVGLEINKRENNGDSSENDEVFTACRGGGALDMLADFASSACFEKEKECERGSPFEGLGKGSKRGRPKKPYSPTPESETTPPTPKKKKKKKKPSASSAKSSKKSSPTSEEKENDFTNREVEQQSPTQIPQEKTELKEQPKPEVLEEQIEKVPELREEPEADESEALPETESVASPEPIKEKRRKSRSSSGKELDESKSPFALFDWQPRRSERIFINSSVTPSNADLSPLSSPTVKSSEFGWPKKTKRLSRGKKSSKTDSLSDVEATEDEAPPTSSKTTTKQKKKKSPAKGKKRRSSSVTDPDFVLKTPKRKAAKRDRSYEEADEDDDEDMADEEEDHDDYQDDTDTEQKNKENQDEMLEEDSQSNKPEKELIDTKDFEMKDEKVENTTVVERSSDGTIKYNNITAESKESISDTDAIGKEARQEEKTGRENTKKDSREDMTKEEVSVKKDKEEKPVDAKESKKKVEKMQDDKETWFKREKEGKREQETTSCAEKNEKSHREVESTTKSFTEDQSSSDELDLISRVKKELPPEPVISFTKEELKENAKMLLPVDRVFYRGRIAFYQDPDLYGIVLPGERGRRPHLRSTEQLLSQAVKDVIPPAIEYLPVGTRVCAHWSPQYRCFYPGSVIDTPPDEKSEVGKLWVEFDDGDSGIFPLSDLRKIKTQYPVQVEDVESDVVVPERRPRSSSRATSPSLTRRSREHDTSLKNKDDDTSGWESSEDAPIKKSKGRAKRRVRLRTRDRTLSEEATDSDAPRGSRDSDFEDNVETSKRGNRSKGDNVKEYETETKPSQVKVPKRERRRIKIRDDISLSSQEKSKDNTKNSETSENAKRDLKSEKFGSKDRDRSKSNVQKQQEDDSDACDDMESTQEAGTSRSRSRSSRLSELDLRKKSLTLSLNSTASSRLGNLDRDSPMQDSTSQDEDSGSCSEVLEESPQTENKAFQPRLGKRRRSQLGKLRQGKSQGELWQWSGKNFQNKRKGKGRKVFYKTIVRGDETISVGDCAVFTSNPSKSNNLPYVGMIENMWEGCSGNMVVKVKWFYHPEETKAGRRASDTKNSLYRSTHVDENDVQTISHKCEVVSPEELKRRSHPHETIGTRSSTNDRTERLFCCVGTYDPSTEKIENV